MNNVLLQTKNLSKIYTDDRKSIVKAVNDITLQIYQGETFGLVGESGCGKSTFGQMLVNLLEPTKGEILFEGEDILKSRRARNPTENPDDLSGPILFSEPEKKNWMAFGRIFRYPPKKSEQRTKNQNCR